MLCVGNIDMPCQFEQMWFETAIAKDPTTKNEMVTDNDVPCYIRHAVHRHCYNAEGEEGRFGWRLRPPGESVCAR